MADPVLHTEASSALSPETGSVVLAIGAVVLLIITYDIYRQQWSETD